MSILTPVHVFGYNTLNSAKNDAGISFLTNEYVVFTSGTHLVKHNVTSNHQTILSLNNHLSSISFVRAFPEKQLILVSGTGDECVKLLLVNQQLQVKHSLSVLTEDPDTTKLLDVQFTKSDEELIMILGHQEQVQLIIMAISQKQLLDKEVLFTSEASVCLSHEGNIQVFTKEEHISFQLKEERLQKVSISALMHHAKSGAQRISDTQIGLLCDEGILVYDSVSGTTGLMSCNGFITSSLVSFEAFSRETLLLGESNGIIHACILNNGVLSKRHSFDVSHRVEHAAFYAISPQYDSILVRSDSGEVYVSQLPPESSWKSNHLERAIRLETSDIDLKSHPKGITLSSFSISSQKPLVATCGSDKALRIWNFATRKKQGFYTFSDVPQCASIHPSGHIIAVGFVDRVKVYATNPHELTLLNEWPIRGSKEIVFSNGGHLLAVASGTTITVINTWSFNILGNLTGHQARISMLAFTSEDFELVSSGHDGALYVWNVVEMRRVQENVVRRCVYYSAGASTSGAAVYACGSDQYLREMIDSQISKEIYLDSKPIQVAVSRTGMLLVVATSTGKIRMHRLPLTENEYEEVQLYSCPILKIQIAADNETLLTLGEDGIIYKIPLTAISEHEQSQENIILITREELEEQLKEIQELETQLEELKAANDYQLRMLDGPIAEKKKEATAKYFKVIEQLKQEEADVRAKKAEWQKIKIKKIDEQSDNIAKASDNLEATFHQQLLKSYELSQKKQIILNETTEKLKSVYEQKLKEQEKIIRQRKTELTAKLKAKVSEVQKMGEELFLQKKEKEEMIRQQEIDVDDEIQQTEQKLQQKFQTVMDESLRIKGENGIMKKKFNSFQKDIDDYKGDMLRLTKESQMLQEVIKRLEKDANKLKKDIQERDDYIHEKEKKVFEMKRSNQELEKFKYVLDHKIKELRRQIEPKETDLREMKAHIEALGRELEEYYVRNTKLEKNIAEVSNKLEVSRHLRDSEKSKATNLKKATENQNKQLNDVIKYIQDDYEKLKDEFMILAKAVGNKKLLGKTEPNYAAAEWDIQRELLEHQIALFKAETDRHAFNNIREESYKILENEELIKELSALRKTKPKYW